MGVNRGEYLSGLDLEAELPWDHIEIGIKKEHLKAEFRRALREEPTASCLETSCGECNGCENLLRPDKSYGEHLEFKPRPADLLGSSAGEEVRYRATYEKIGRARFLAHNDLLNIIRRSFRRAGVAVLHSAGFHPKMRMSFLPALPLGMEGLAEALEFRSGRRFEEEELLARVNQNVPLGVRFLSLAKMDPSAPSLSAATAGFVYSLDLDRPEVKAALETFRAGVCSGEAVSPKPPDLEEALALAFPGQEASVSLDREKNKLFLRLFVSASRSPRAQEAVARVFGLENPVFFMSRESVIYK